MADDEKLNLRDLPPVEPVAVYDAGRMSQTLAAKMDACPRAGYLYLKYSGGPGSHAMDRGTVVHIAAERMMLELIRTGSKSMLEIAVSQGPGGVLVAEDIAQAEGELASMTKSLVDEILEENHDLNPTSLEADAARAMAWHVAIGMDVDPEKVLGVERKFVLELPSGMVVSGKVDLLSTPDVHWLQVDDYKTSFNVPPEEEFDELHSFQTKLYAALAVFGNPAEKEPCARCAGSGIVGDGMERDCPACRGRGAVEVRLPNIGEGVFYARGRQLYPRSQLRVLPDGRKELVQRERVFTRTELADFLVDLERIAGRLRRGLETWKFPAIPGRHCSECPASPECPLPSHLRRYAGIVNSHDEAAEAYAWLLVMKDRTSATEKEIKAWAKVNGPVLIGKELYGWTVKPSSSRQFRTRKGRSMLPEFVAAAKEAAKYGTVLNEDDFLRPASDRNEFGPLKASPDLVAQKQREISDGRGDGAGPVVDFDEPGEQPPGADDVGGDAVG